PRLVISTIDMQTVLKNWNRVASIEELAKDRVSYQKEKQPVLALHELPQNDIQLWVSENWQHLLGLKAIALHDNFFAIGGHSLAAVQFVTKIKEIFNVKTHVMNLYELPTLQQFSEFLEKQIKQKQEKNQISIL
nr:hypothetical protein [Tatlockia sp.]